jgi:hypothetical protein
MHPEHLLMGPKEEEEEEVITTSVYMTPHL